jgi:radical SAM superfamily enzyme YgiQ (UPF0313 family)
MIEIKGSNKDYHNMNGTTTGPLRPPSEAHSLLIRVTENCPWNRCEFCATFKGKAFHIRNMEEIQRDILAARDVADSLRAWAKQTGQKKTQAARASGILWLQEDGVKTAFLQDSDSLVMKTGQLVDVIRFLYSTFPEVERLSSYTRARTLLARSLHELRQLKKAGLVRLHVGLESGDDDILACIQKGSTAQQIIEGSLKAKEAGFELSLYVMPGLGGRDRWGRHIIGTAKVLNQIDPHFIRLRTLQLLPGTPLYEKAKKGEFHVQSVAGVLREIQRLIQELDLTSELISSDFALNFFLKEADGKLPEDKEELLQRVRDALDDWQARGEPAPNPFAGGLRQH